MFISEISIWGRVAAAVHSNTQFSWNGNHWPFGNRTWEDNSDKLGVSLSLQ